MNSHLAAIGPLLAAPWRWRLNRISPLMLWGGALALVLLLGLLTLIKGGRVGAASAGLAGAGLLVSAWLLTLGGLERQNEPRLARLVPGHVLRLRLAVLLLWGLPVLAAGAGAAWLEADIWKALLLTGLGLSVLTAFLRWPLSFVLVWFLPATVPLWRGNPLADGLTQAWMAQWQLRPGLLCLLLLGVLALFQAGFIGTGDAGHARRYQRMQRLLASMQEGSVGLSLRHQGRLGFGVARIFTALYRRWMQHLLARPRATASDVVARLELVLHGHNHWTGILGSALLILCVAAVLGGIVGLFLPADALQALQQTPNKAGWLLLALTNLCIGLCMGMVVGQTQVLYRTRREQALLMLLPGLPLAGQLRARLLRRQGMQCLLLVLCALVLLNLAHALLPVQQGSWHATSVGEAMVLALILLSLMPLLPWRRREQASQSLPVLMGLAGYVLWQMVIPDSWSLTGRTGLVLACLALAAVAWGLVIRQAARDPAMPLPAGRGSQPAA